MNEKNIPPALIFSVENDGMLLKLAISDSATEQQVLDLASLCILVLSKNKELMNICVEQASMVGKHAKLLTAILSQYKKKRATKPAVNPLDALNF